MPEANNLDNEFWRLVGIFAAPILLGLLISLCVFINEFSSELRYLNSEIGRTTGAERRYYIRKRRRLWLSLIPFVKYR